MRSVVLWRLTACLALCGAISGCGDASDAGEAARAPALTPGGDGGIVDTGSGSTCDGSATVPYSDAQLTAARALAWETFRSAGWIAVGMTAPRVVWVQGAALDCADGTGYLLGGVCFGGDFDVRQWLARVAVVPGRALGEDGVLAHELAHAVACGDGYWLDGRAAHCDKLHTGRAFCDVEGACAPTDDDEAPAAAGWSRTVSAALSAAGY